MRVQRPKERKRGVWNSEVVSGIGVGMVSKGNWQTRPEKKVNKILKSFLCHAKKLSLFYSQWRNSKELLSGGRDDEIDVLLGRYI